MSDDYTESTVKLTYADLMTIVKAESGNVGYSNQHVARGKDVQKLGKTYDFEAKASTLNQIIEKSKFTKIDFMSLDLEGYEYEALQGLDLSKWGPKYLMLEVRDLSKIQAILGHRYQIVEELTSSPEYKDILFQSTL